MPGEFQAGTLMEGSRLSRLQTEKLAAAADLPTFCSNWLALVCGPAHGCLSAAVFWCAAASNELELKARWATSQADSDFDGGSLPRLEAASRAAQIEGGGLLLDGKILQAVGRGTAGSVFIAVPIEVDGKPLGYAAVESAMPKGVAPRLLLEKLQWATGWFSWFVYRDRLRVDLPVQWRMQTTLDVFAAAVGHRHFRETALAFVNELAARFGCDRVSLGHVRRDRVRILAVSGSSTAKVKTNIAEQLSAAMEEALDQLSPIAYPAAAQTPAEKRVTRAHAELCAGMGRPRAALTLPMISVGQPVGGLTLERDTDRPFTADEIEMLHATADLVAPLIELHRREDRFIGIKMAEAAGEAFTLLVGPGHSVAKLTAIGLLAVVLFFSFAKWDYRVTAACAVEAEVTRATAAPFDSYLKEAHVRAGDLVNEGQVLAVLEDRELQQQRLEALSRRSEASRVFDQALGEHKLAEAGIADSQADRAAAELALTEERLSLTRLRAPFKAVVVSGDLSQALNAPLRQGQVLFELAPLDRFRLALEVEDRDIGEDLNGKDGELRLASRPEKTYPIRVYRLTPSATVKDGNNVFRVEAQLSEQMPWLRPGMQGVAKVHVGRRLIIWIWTHRIVDFLRVKLWF